MTDKAPRDYSSQFSNLTFEERAKNTLRMYRDMHDALHPDDKYVNSLILNKDHAHRISKLSRRLKISFISDSLEAKPNQNGFKIEADHPSSDIWYEYEEYEQIDLEEARNLDGGDYLREIKGNIAGLKISFSVTFRVISDKGNERDLAYYNLSEQRLTFYDEEEESWRKLPPKYYKSDIKRQVRNWINDAKLPIGGKKTVFYKTDV